MNVHIGLLFLQNNNFSDHPSSAKFKTQLTLSYYLVLTENVTQTLVAKLRVEVWPKISNLLIFTAKLHFQRGIVVACIIAALKQLLEIKRAFVHACSILQISRNSQGGDDSKSQECDRTLLFIQIHQTKIYRR
jgi:hypothetical protein